MNDVLAPAVQQFLTVLLTGVLTVAAAFIIALVKKGFDWLSEKTKLVADERSQQAVNHALQSLCDITETTVVSLNQTLGDAIRESISKGDGKYTKEDLYALKTKAVESIKNQLTESAAEALMTTYGDLDDYINNLVEQILRGVKSADLQTALKTDATRKLLNE